MASVLQFSGQTSKQEDMPAGFSAKEDARHSIDDLLRKAFAAVADARQAAQMARDATHPFSDMLARQASATMLCIALDGVLYDVRSTVNTLINGNPHGTVSMPVGVQPDNSYI